MTDNTREVQLKATMDATGVRAGVEQAKTALGDLSSAAQREGSKAGAGIEQVAQGAERSAAASERALGRMEAQIRRLSAEYKAAAEGTGKAGAILNQAIAQGLDVSRLQPGIDKLRELERAATSNLGNIGVSAAQTAAALRQVPAQFTDIATSLAAGQAPLTVFLQQGGQLKDAFGGAGAAARALGGYILGLINPLTVAAAAAGVLAFAYKQGSDEGQAFTRSLILSGNQAGLTAATLQDLARAQSAVVGTQGEAADVLAKLAGTGRVSAQVIEAAAEALVRFSRAGGSVDDTVKKFERLGKEPLKAVIELNDAENFLTVSVYKQIKALEDQGRTLEAANLAQQTYAATLNSRAQQIEQNLGSIERGWLTVKDAAKAAWDAMLNVGRPQSKAALDQQIESLERQQRVLTQGNAAQKTQAVLIGEQVSALRQQRDALAEVEGQLKRAAAAAQTRAAETDKAIKADKDAEKASKAMNGELERQRKLIAELAGLSGDFAQDWDELSKLYKQGKLSLEQLLDAQAKLLAKQPAIRDAAKAEADAQKQVADAMARGNELYLKKIEALQQNADAVGKQVQKLRDEEEALGLSAALNISLAQAIEQVIIKRLQEQQVAAKGDQPTIDAIQREIDARRELITLIGNKDARDAAKKAAEEAARDWQRVSDQIGQGLTDSLFRAFEAGRGFFDTLWKGIVNTFKTTALKLVIQGADGKSGIVGSALNAIGVPGFSSGGLGGLASIGSSLSSLSGTLSGLLGGSGAGLGLDFVNSSIGQALGLSSTQTIGGNLIAGPTALGNSVLGSAGSVVGYAGALYNLSQGKYGAAAGAGIGTFFGGPIGAAIGSAIGSAVDKIFSGGAGTPHMGADYVSTATGGYRPGANEVGIFSAGASVNQNRSQAVEDTLKVLTGTGAGLLNSLATAFGKQANYAVGGYFAADGRDPAQANTRITAGGQTISSTATRYGVSDAKEGINAFTTELAGQVRSALAAMDIPEWAKSQLNGLANSAGFEELANAVQQITVTKQALEQLGAVMPQLSNLTGTAVEGLLKAVGGIDNLRAAASSYYDNFYTDAEKTASATAALTKELAAFGLSVPASREAYRALVEAQDLNTEAGRAAYAELLKLSPAFAALVPATVQLGEAADTSAEAMRQAAAKMAEAGRKVLADLADTQGSLQVDLLRAQGEVEQAAALERQRAISKLTEGLSAQDAAAAVAAYDFNQALRQQIDALIAAKTAAQQAADAETQRAAAAAQAEAARIAAVGQERTSLETRLLQLQGNTVELRNRDLASIDATNRAILENIFALEDQHAAQRAAAQAAQEAEQAARALEAAQQAAADAEARRVQSIANERDSLITRLLQAQGNTQALRERELANVDATNRDILAQIFAMEDQRAAQQAAAQAAQEAAAAAAEAARQAEQLRQAWQSVTDGIYGEVKRIRGLTGGSAQQSLAGAQSQFAITTAQARAGDQEAAKLLPGLSQTLLQLAEANATNLVDLQRIRAQIAASLEQTGASLVARFGLTLPKFAVGTNYVPRDMAAIVHEGEAIVPRAFNPAANGVGGSASSSALLDEVAGLREDARAQALAVVKLQTEIARLLKTWDGGGIPEQRSTT